MKGKRCGCFTSGSFAREPQTLGSGWWESGGRGALPTPGAGTLHAVWVSLGASHPSTLGMAGLLFGLASLSSLCVGAGPIWAEIAENTQSPSQTFCFHVLTAHPLSGLEFSYLILTFPHKRKLYSLQHFSM